MVLRIITFLFALLFLAGLTSGVGLQCSNFDQKFVEDSCKENQEALPAEDRPALNFQLLTSLSDKSGRELAKDYNEDISDSYFEKYAVNAESFYIDKAWVYIRNPFRSVKIRNRNLVSPSKGNIEIKTGYEINKRSKKGFIDIDNSANSCSNKAKLLDVEEELKTNFSAPINDRNLAYNLNQSAVIKAKYKLKTELEIKDRDLVCTGNKKCKLECRSTGITTTIEEEIFTDVNKVNIVEVNSSDFSVGKTYSETVFDIDNPEKYLEINFSFGEDNLFLSKEVQDFHGAENGKRFYPVYSEEFQTKKISGSSISARPLDSGKILINKSIENGCGFHFETLSLDSKDSLECRIGSADISKKDLRDSVDVNGYRSLSYFIIPLFVFLWVYWYMWR